ncbi:MAG TPA: hypothetical protein VMA83_07340 [Solirubrobacteraceae bacterium]|nr:hypothetical protein [Solirubrobacteraceae bacterium]
MWQAYARAALQDALQLHTAGAGSGRCGQTLGLQRTITRFGLLPAGDGRIASVHRHWYLDRDGPRPESAIVSASEATERERRAGEERSRQPAPADIAAARDPAPEG